MKVDVLRTMCAHEKIICAVFMSWRGVGSSFSQV